LRRHGGGSERLGVGAPGRAAEDCEVIARLLEAGHTVRFDPAAVVRHDWTTGRRRLKTRWSYAYGIGAMCGLRLRDRDWFGASMLRSYARVHARDLCSGVLHLEARPLVEHPLALLGLAGGLRHGLRVAGPVRNYADPHPEPS
jgi:hypothetical protein